MDGAAGTGPGGAEDLSRDVGGDDRGRARGDQQADTGGGRDPARLIAAGQERAQAQKRGQEHARRLIEAGQERARQEKREREQERQRERDRDEDFELEP